MEIQKTQFLALSISAALICLSSNVYAADQTQQIVTQGVKSSITVAPASENVLLPQNVQGKDIATNATGLFSSIGSSLKAGFQKINASNADNKENNNTNNEVNNASTNVTPANNDKSTKNSRYNDANTTKAENTETNNAEKPKEETSMFANMGSAFKSGFQKATAVTGNALKKTGEGLQTFAKSNDNKTNQNDASNVEVDRSTNVNSNNIAENVTPVNTTQNVEEVPVSDKVKNKNETKSSVKDIRNKAEKTNDKTEKVSNTLF